MPTWTGKCWAFSELEIARQKRLFEELKRLATKESFVIKTGPVLTVPATMFIPPKYRRNQTRRMPVLAILHYAGGALGLDLITPYKQAQKRFETVQFAVANRLAFGGQRRIPGLDTLEPDWVVAP